MKETKIALGAGIGLLAGIIIGSATDNVGLWIALGLCFGAGIGTTLEKNRMIAEMNLNHRHIFFF